MSYTNSIGSPHQLSTPMTTAATAPWSQANIGTRKKTPRLTSNNISDDQTSFSAAASLIAQPPDGSDVRSERVSALQQAISMARTTSQPPTSRESSSRPWCARMTSDLTIAQILDETTRALAVMDLMKLSGVRGTRPTLGILSDLVRDSAHKIVPAEISPTKSDSERHPFKPKTSPPRLWQRDRKSMGTLTSLFNVSLSALQADQVALNVTANNVANQNTVGYTRETVNFQSADTVTLNGASEGGVTTGAGPVSQRDRILEQRVQQQTQQQAQSSTLQSALEQIQNVFGLTSTAPPPALPR